MSTILSGCQESVSTATDSEGLVFFNSDDFEILTQIVDVILPKTDSPSATEVGVHHLIDRMVGEVYKPEDQKVYQANYDKLSAYLQKSEQIESGIKDLMSNKEDSAYGALLTLKQQTVAFYLSTEEVSKNHLNYLPVPGEYEGCISIESVNNKAWA